jgi:hypothetical protein
MSNKMRGRMRVPRLMPTVIAAGLVGAALLTASTTGTLSGFVASIQNSTNTAATGTLVMQEQNAGATVTCLSTDGGSVSTNTATCSTINKFGGSTTMVPGGSTATTVTIKNAGTASASTFTLAPTGVCTQSNNGTTNGSSTTLCSTMTIAVSGGTTVASQTLDAFYAAYKTGGTSGPISLGTVAPGATVSFTFTVSLPAGATNTSQGLAASMPLTWTFNS